jgi:hypothetical protein
MDSTAPPKPTASVTIEPKGPRTPGQREHAVKVTLRLSTLDPKYSDRTRLTDVARSALVGFGVGTVGDLLGKTGNKVVGVEGSVNCPDRPAQSSVDAMREALSAGGYSVAIREVRECTEDGCLTVVMTDWNRPLEVPTSWYSSAVCGKHGYRSCANCDSTYLMSSSNAAGQAPSLHCEVCGTIMIEWGGTKVWTAQLVSRNDRVRS